MASRHLESASAHLGEHALRNLALLCVLVFLSYRIVRYLTGWRSLGRAYALAGCERPAAYPHRDPVFGLDALVATVAAARDKTFLASTAQRFQDLGAYTYYTWVQGRQTVHTAEPDNVRAVLATCSKDYSIAARKALLGRFLGRGIFVSEGEAWAHARARLRPSFAREQVTDLAMLERHVQALLRVLPGGGGGGGGGVVDLQAYFTRFTLDSASEFLFGHSAHTLARPSARDQAFGAAFDFSVGHVAEKARRGPLDRFYRRDPREDAARRICRDYVGAFVDEAVALRAAIQAEEAAVLGDKGEQQPPREDGDGPPPRHCFLRELARAIDDREHICDEILSMMGAGRDTTASLLSSTFHVLSRRPDIWRTLRGEIEDLRGAPPSYEQLRALKFAKYILNETLRLYPPVFQNSRLAVRDTILPTGGGPRGTAPVLVPAGSAVIYSLWAMHRRKDLFGPDALEFRPERWAAPQRHHGWDYVPFGGGPRICLGQQYALTEAAYVLVRMAQAFASVEAADDGPWTEKLSLTLSVEGGVNCRLTRA